MDTNIDINPNPQDNIPIQDDARMISIFPEILRDCKFGHWLKTESDARAYLQNSENKLPTNGTKVVIEWVGEIRYITLKNPKNKCTIEIHHGDTNPDTGDHPISVSINNGEDIDLVEMTKGFISEITGRETNTKVILTEFRSGVDWMSSYVHPIKDTDGHYKEFHVLLGELDSLPAILSLFHEIGHVVAFMAQEENYARMHSPMEYIEAYNAGQIRPQGKKIPEQLYKLAEFDSNVIKEIDAWMVAFELMRRLGLDKLIDQETYCNFVLTAIKTRLRVFNRQI